MKLGNLGTIVRNKGHFTRNMVITTKVTTSKMMDVRGYFKMYLERKASQNTTIVGGSLIVQCLLQAGLL